MRDLRGPKVPLSENFKLGHSKDINPSHLPHIFRLMATTFEGKLSQNPAETLRQMCGVDAFSVQAVCDVLRTQQFLAVSLSRHIQSESVSENLVGLRLTFPINYRGPIWILSLISIRTFCCCFFFTLRVSTESALRSTRSQAQSDRRSWFDDNGLNMGFVEQT